MSHNVSTPLNLAEAYGMRMSAPDLPFVAYLEIIRERERDDEREGR